MVELRKYRTAFGLPGGPRYYVANLALFLQVLSEQTSSLSRKEALNEMMRVFPIRERRADGCLQMISRLGMIQIDQDSALSLTDLGVAFLAADEDSRALSIAEILLRRFLAFAETLGYFAAANEPLSGDEVIGSITDKFEWGSHWSAKARVDWLTAVSCIEKGNGGIFQITARGLTLAERFPPGAYAVSANSKGHVYRRQVDQLFKEIDNASVDGSESKRFERAMADACRFLGYDVEELGGPGTTDLLVSANIGSSSYRVIVDTKARHQGKLDSLNPNTLEDHRDSLGANYVVVVAKQFVGDKVHRHARGKILLLSTSMLHKLLISHAETPLSLTDYEIIFQTTGELTELPPTLVGTIERTKQAAYLVRSVVNIMHRAYALGWTKLLLAESITAMLVTHFGETNYAVEEVRQALELLVHPTINAGFAVSEGFTLTVSKKTLARKLRTLADIIEMNA